MCSGIDMLIYHPAFDAYHCLFRTLAILEVCRSSEPDRLRILDFCLSFPNVVSEFRLPPGRVHVKRAAMSTASPYRDPISSRAVFANLTSIQLAAFSCLTATGLVTRDAGVIIRTEKAMPKAIKDGCVDIQLREKVFFDSLLSQLTELPLLGPDGLKARSGLLEFRYDPT